MIDLAVAYRILNEAILQPIEPEVPTLLLTEVAARAKLEIVPLNVTRGHYFGTCLGVDGQKFLMTVRTGAALLVNKDDIENGSELPSPRPGDQVKVECNHGIVRIFVEVSERNKREDLHRKKFESQNGSHKK